MLREMAAPWLYDAGFNQLTFTLHSAVIFCPYEDGFVNFYDYGCCHLEFLTQRHTFAKLLQKDYLQDFLARFQAAFYGGHASIATSRRLFRFLSFFFDLPDRRGCKQPSRRTSGITSVFRINLKCQHFCFSLITILQTPVPEHLFRLTDSPPSVQLLLSRRNLAAATALISVNTISHSLPADNQWNTIFMPFQHVGESLR